MLSKEFIEKMKIKLDDERKNVELKIDELKKAEEPMDNPKVEDIAMDAEQDILEDSLRSVYKNILDRIDSALDRIKNGTYGICLKCGIEIKEEDLVKEPWAEHCNVCGKK